MNKGQSKIHISLLQGLVNELTNENFLALKELCKAETYGRLGAGQLEKIQTLTQLFEKLQQKKVFNQGNYANLKSLLSECEAEDTVTMVETAEKELFEAGYTVEGYHKPDHAVQMPTPAPPRQPPAGLHKADDHFSSLRQRKEEMRWESDNEHESNVREPEEENNKLEDYIENAVVNECSLRNLSGLLTSEWKDLGTELGLTEAQLQHIKKDHQGEKEIIYQMLLFWKRAKGREATFGHILRKLKKVGRADLVDPGKLEEKWINI